MALPLAKVAVGAVLKSAGRARGSASRSISGPRATVDISGFAELDKALGELGKRTGKATLRRAGRKALGVFVEEARRRAPVDDGALRNSLAVSQKLAKSQQRKLNRARAEGRFSVLLFGGATALPHAHLVEFGTGPRVQTTTGRATGIMPAQPFMRPAWAATKDSVLDGVAKELAVEIRKSAARAAKRAARGTGSRRGS